MGALDKVADHFARMPGRKSLDLGVGWLSGTSVGPKGAKVSYQQEFETLIEKLNRADVGVYTIVACGLSPRPCGYPLNAAGSPRSAPAPRRFMTGTISTRASAQRWKITRWDTRWRIVCPIIMKWGRTKSR